jgi:hypothetical protein
MKFYFRDTTLGPGGAWTDLPRSLLVAMDGDFRARVKKLERAAAASAQRLSAKPSPRGRPPNAAFRDFATELVRLYEQIPDEQIPGRTALKPYWLPDSGMYGSRFYRFAIAVWQCLGSRVSECKGALPKTEGTLAEELQNHCPKENPFTG